MILDMTLARTASATCLLIGLAVPAVAEPCWNCGVGDLTHRNVAPDGSLRHRHEAVRAPVGKPRICYRPDVGRHSRLIPYEC